MPRLRFVRYADQKGSGRPDRLALGKPPTRAAPAAPENVRSRGLLLVYTQAGAWGNSPVASQPCLRYAIRGAARNHIFFILFFFAVAETLYGI